MNRFTHFDTLGDNFGVIDWESDHDSTTVVNKYETDTYKNAVKMLADWYDKGYIYKDAQTDTSGSSTMMKAGNTFSYATAIKPGMLVEAEAANGMDCYAMYFGTGTEPTSNEGTRSVLFTGNACLYNTGIATNSEDPAMAFKFVSALYTDPTLMNLWQYGIEDVNYKKNDDGTIYYADGEDCLLYTSLQLKSLTQTIYGHWRKTSVSLRFTTATDFSGQERNSWKQERQNICWN